MFTRPAGVGESAPDDSAPVAPAEPAAAKRPPRWSMRNWPVRWKVIAIVLVPLVLASVFGGLRIYGAMTDAAGLRLAAKRADVIPAITKYMSALDVALIATSTGGDTAGATKNYDARKYELQARLADTDVAPDVRTGIDTLLNGGQALLNKVASNSIGLRDRVTAYTPILLTAEDAVNGLVRVDDERIRAEAQGLSRAIGIRGQMMMQQLLVTRGADLPEPELRNSLITLAGTEPSTLFGMSEVLGVGSSAAKTLQQQMVTRMAIMSDPANTLVNNPELLRSIQTTDSIAAQVIQDTTASVTKSVEQVAADRPDTAMRDAVVVLAAILSALIIVLLVARSLVQPLRALRDSALKVAHQDLEHEISRVRAGDERPPEPLPVHTSEEIGQVAHAVDELHTQALLLAGDEARLRLLVNDMFETMSRRNRSLVDQQLSLIDRLERNEDDPDRLESLFRLDHLAARMRRNGANLLVLAGAQISPDQRGPVPLSTVVDAARSEVEDYRRVETTMLPDCALTGAAAGDLIHLLAELIDNGLRYSPPTSPVWVSAGMVGDGRVLVEITDSGLGMTDGDLRMANMRLVAGGEATPDSARHMGLFVVGRLGARHGMRVRLRPSTADEATSGTTAEVCLPRRVLVDALVESQHAPPALARGASRPAVPIEEAARPVAPPEPAAAVDTVDRNGAHPAKPPVTRLPRRNPGSSGITEVPVEPTVAADQPDQQGRHELPRLWRESDRQSPEEPAAQQPAAQQPAAQQPVAQPVETSGYFSAQSRVAGDGEPPAQQLAAPQAHMQPVLPDRGAFAAEPATHPAESPEEDLIYQRMLSEWLVDPHELAQSADLDWKSVWDRGWSMAAEAENVPVESHTDQGLPVREPGARLVPGAAAPDTSSPANGTTRFSKHHGPDQEYEVASHARHQAPARDPDAIRASISGHFGGVRAGRSHAPETSQGFDQE